MGRSFRLVDMMAVLLIAIGLQGCVVKAEKKVPVFQDTSCSPSDTNQQDTADIAEDTAQDTLVDTLPDTPQYLDTEPELVASSEHVFGPAGGRFLFEDGVLFVIPEGALDRDVEVVVGRMPGVELPDWFSPLADVLVVEADVTEFLLPIHIYLPLGDEVPDDLDWSRFSGAVSSDEGQTWTTLPATIEPVTGNAHLQTTHLSWFCAGVAVGTGCIPTDEICNGLDDDCDGGVDEDLCVVQDNPCLASACDPASGECVSSPANEGEACDADDDLCTLGDHCQAGTCVAGSPVVCDDQNECTTDECDQGLCIFTPNQAACDDDNPCTQGDHCSSGACMPTGMTQCDDGNPCTSDSCDLVDGCTHQPTEGDCEDGNRCTIGDTCQSGECVAGGELSCNDGNPCTDDSCSPTAGCLYAMNAVSCDDGNVCTQGDICLGGSCRSGPDIDCDDENLCTVDFCDFSAGCVHLPVALACDDADACTENDRCSEGICGGAQVDCDDGNPCTSDSCSPDSGCTHENVSGECDDLNACTLGDSCVDGVCFGDEAVDCDDRLPCTDDSCTPETGCANVPRDGACEDGNQCSVDDFCLEGQCISGSIRDCNDNNVCTSDSCEPLTGCTHSPISGSCNDGDPCSVNDTCNAGVCSPGSSLVCDDSNPCTEDACQPMVGCIYSPWSIGTDCDDSDPCTIGDMCDGEGTCTPGTSKEPECNDNNDCTFDTCSSDGTQCIYQVIDGCCNLDNPCPEGDTCLEGFCCTPDCADDQGVPFECSLDDGCGGTCGTCGEGTTCNTENVCVCPTCCGSDSDCLRDETCQAIDGGNTDCRKMVASFQALFDDETVGQPSSSFTYTYPSGTNPTTSPWTISSSVFRSGTKSLRYFAYKISTSLNFTAFTPGPGQPSALSFYVMCNGNEGSPAWTLDIIVDDEVIAQTSYAVCINGTWIRLSWPLDNLAAGDHVFELFLQSNVFSPQIYIDDFMVLIPDCQTMGTGYQPNSDGLCVQQ